MIPRPFPPPATLDLGALAARLPRHPRTRFAPAPTGYLHLGHVANAIYVWGLARALDGRVLLRIEDHDRTRSRRAFEVAILEDLAWLGLEPDEGTAAELNAGRCAWRQSDVPNVYAASAAALTRAGRLYACDCSRRTMTTTQTTPSGDEPRYPNTCRDRGLAIEDGRGVRVRLDPGVETFDDGLCGRVRQEPCAQCGDVLIRDRHGHWTYQFAVVVDDLRQQVDLVIRGADLLASTGRQIQLARLLGRDAPPVFLHHGLIVRADGAKLSKSNGDTGVRDLRAAGHTAADVLGLAARACGLLGAPRPVRVEELGALVAGGASGSG